MMMKRRRERGFTLAELVMVCGLIAILTTMAMPVAKFTVKRQKEAELRLALRQIRTAIDEYKRMSDQGLIPLTIGGEGYPELLIEQHHDHARRAGLFCKPLGVTRERYAGLTDHGLVHRPGCDRLDGAVLAGGERSLQRSQNIGAVICAGFARLAPDVAIDLSDVHEAWFETGSQKIVHRDRQVQLSGAFRH